MLLVLYLGLRCRVARCCSEAQGTLVIHSKNKTPVLGNALPVFGMNLKRGSAFLVIFQRRPMFSHIIMESSRRDLLNDNAEHCIISWKIIEIRTTPKYVPPQMIYVPVSVYTQNRYRFPQNGVCFYRVAADSELDSAYFSAAVKTVDENRSAIGLLSGRADQ